MKNQQKYAILLSALVVLITAVASGPVHATALNLIANPSFESPTVSGQTWETSLSSWTLSEAVSLQNNGTFYAGNTAHDGSQWLQLEAYNGASTVSQSFPTTLGHQYEISFWYAAVVNTSSGEDTMTWSVGSDTPPALTIDWGTPTALVGGQLTSWQHEIYTYTAGAGLSTLLSFTGETVTSYYGPSLDDVTVNDITPPPPVPEPATFALLLIGGGLMVWRRSKKV